MAAPYAADPPIAAIAIPAVVPLTEDDVFWELLLNTPEFPEATLDDAAVELSVEVDPLSLIVEPTLRGMAELM